MKETETYRIHRLEAILSEGGAEAMEWLREKASDLIRKPDGSRFYIAFSQCSAHFSDAVVFDAEHEAGGKGEDYLKEHGITVLEYARMWLLGVLLTENRAFYEEKVRKLIEVADSGELQTFLRYLHTLPGSGEFSFAAVEALRSNIVPVFNAISQRNPYPALQFNEQQWNQMYLKAAFLGCDLNGILRVEERANPNLARIISDYAHERWAASRQIDPVIWRPVSAFLNDTLLEDMKRLLKSDLLAENEAAALVLTKSDHPLAGELLDARPELQEGVRQGNITWDRLGKSTHTS